MGFVSVGSHPFRQHQLWGYITQINNNKINVRFKLSCFSSVYCLKCILKSKLNSCWLNMMWVKIVHLVGNHLTMLSAWNLGILWWFVATKGLLVFLWFTDWLRRKSRFSVRWWYIIEPGSLPEAIVWPQKTDTSNKD